MALWLVVVGSGAAASVTAGTGAPLGTTINPTPPGASPLGSGSPAPLFPADAPDPFVYPVGSTYYMFSTQQTGGFDNVPVWQSSDLASWQRVADAMPTLPGWALFGHTWAPSILKIAGGYRLFFTARHAFSGRQCIGTATSASPAGPYVPSPEILICQFDRGGSIDPMVFTDDNGITYLYWKSDDNALLKASTLWAQPLAADGLTLEGRPIPLLNEDQPWEPPTIEAPAMLHVARHYWLFYSGNGLSRASYALGYAECAGPLGPCTKQTTAAPWFGSNLAVAGPGEESFFTDANNNIWMAFDGWTPGQIDYPNGGARSPHLAMILFRPNQPPTMAPPARAVAANPNGGYYVLTGNGDVLAFGGAPSFGQPYFSFDIARSMSVMPDGQGYAILDGWGGVHRYGSAVNLPVDPSVHWNGWDIARSIAVMPDGQGYAILDGYGGVHPTGTATNLPATIGHWNGWDIARSIAVMPDGQGYAVLDGWGGVHLAGSAGSLPVNANAYWPGRDVARSILITPSGAGYAVLDTSGAVHPTGDAPTPSPPSGVSGTWSGLTLLATGHYALVRSDSLSADW